MARPPTKAAAAGGFSVTSRMKGVRTSAANIRAMDKAARRRFFEELIKIADDVLDRSKERYVPILSSDLKDSGRVMPHPGRYPSVEVGFGGVAVSYAVIQHENLEFRHPGGKKAKYLELAVKDFEPQIRHRLSVAAAGEIRLYDMRGKVRI